ncbi:MAG TPA: histidine kinase, partial [Candidatus Blautia avicola]|nr:histidine kinase [Candidatus Blautia avicola]
MDKIKVHLLGRPYVEVNGKRVNFPYKKAEGFFYYLCVKKNATREEIIYVLWGADNENVGRKNLREAVYQIKKLLGKEILVTEGHTGIGLNPEYVLEIDWDHVKEDYIPENEEEDFLAHFHIKNCYEFEEWVSSMQEQYDRHIMTAVKKKLKEADIHKNMGQI